MKYHLCEEDSLLCRIKPVNFCLNFRISDVGPGGFSKHKRFNNLINITRSFNGSPGTVQQTEISDISVPANAANAVINLYINLNLTFPKLISIKIRLRVHAFND